MSHSCAVAACFIMLAIVFAGCNQPADGEQEVDLWPKDNSIRGSSFEDQSNFDLNTSRNDDIANLDPANELTSRDERLELADTIPDLDISSVSIADDDHDTKNVIDLQELLSQGKHKEAITKLKSAIIASPRNAVLHYYLGVVYHRSDNPHAAVPYLDKSLELAPGDLRMLRERAAILIRLEKHVEAIADLTSILELEPESARDLIQRAMLHMHSRDFSKAKQDLTQAIELDPSIPEAYYGRCLIFLRDRQFDDARSDLLNAEKYGLLEDRLTELKQYFAKATSSTSNSQQKKATP